MKDKFHESICAVGMSKSVKNRFHESICAGGMSKKMKLFRKIHGKLQAHIVSVFTGLLIISFAMIGLTFNFSVHRYISTGATNALALARNEPASTAGAGVIMRAVRGSHRFSYANVQAFQFSSLFVNISSSSNAAEIMQRLDETRTPLTFTEGKRLRVNHQVFYISIVPGEPYGVIYYLDVTDIIMFTLVVNRLLIGSVFMIWILSMIIAGFLADSMMRPLRLLRDFVRQIGRGDFTPNAHSFANEEFDELNQSLNSTARQLAMYDNEQKAFFQNVSHELRTPLMSIKSYAEGINIGIMDSKTASSTIIEATDHLTELVGDILYVSRIDNVAPPPMEKINLCIIVTERINRQKSMAELKNVEIKYASDNMPIIVNCAVKYIERAVDNLISNAIRYAKTEIIVECYAIGSRATIRVIDDGPGFEPDALPHVFERFFRGKNGLTGIGLSTVKSITDQHKGTAAAENGNEHGAILTITLPRHKGM
ncbi:MAG: HAMP domain-containing histidine kinase [Defluviitaleaceae bacterium]|nr:HAMP domain-containing histidine kinase [Defluviitaleaceae bacterium]